MVRHAEISVRGTTDINRTHFQGTAGSHRRGKQQRPLARARVSPGACVVCGRGDRRLFVKYLGNHSSSKNTSLMPATVAAASATPKKI